MSYNLSHVKKQRHPSKTVGLSCCQESGGLAPQRKHLHKFSATWSSQKHRVLLGIDDSLLLPSNLPLGGPQTTELSQHREEAIPVILTDCPQPTDTRCANHKKCKESTSLSPSKWVTFPGCRNAGRVPHPSPLSALGKRLGERLRPPMNTAHPAEHTLWGPQGDWDFLTGKGGSWLSLGPPTLLRI